MREEGGSGDKIGALERNELRSDDSLETHEMTLRPFHPGTFESSAGGSHRMLNNYCTYRKSQFGAQLNTLLEVALFFLR